MQPTEWVVVVLFCLVPAYHSFPCIPNCFVQAVTCYLWIWEDLDKYVEEMVAYSRTGKYDYLRETCDMLRGQLGFQFWNRVFFLLGIRNSQNHPSFENFGTFWLNSPKIANYQKFWARYGLVGGCWNYWNFIPKLQSLKGNTRREEAEHHVITSPWCRRVAIAVT